MDKQAFLAEIRATHEPLAAAVGTLTDDAWDEPLPDMAGWTRKDALAHVGWWSDHSVRVITALRAGRVPYERDPDFDIDAQNQSILAEFRDRDAGEVRALEAAAFERLIAAVEATSARNCPRPTGSPGWRGHARDRRRLGLDQALPGAPAAPHGLANEYQVQGWSRDQSRSATSAAGPRRGFRPAVRPRLCPGPRIDPKASDELIPSSRTPPNDVGRPMSGQFSLDEAEHRSDRRGHRGRPQLNEAHR